MTGGGGRLAVAVHGGLESAGWEIVALGRERLDITDRRAVDEAFVAWRPDAALNLAAITDVEACERDPHSAAGVNATAVGHLRDAAQRVGAHLCHVSTDYVFDGAQSRPYRVDDAPGPLSAYARSKRDGELLAGPDATVVRVAWLSGMVGRGLVRTVLEQAREPGAELRFVADQLGSPTVSDDLVPVFDHLLRERVPGFVHAANVGVGSPFEVAERVLAAAGLDSVELLPSRLVDAIDGSIRRPAYSVLDTSSLVECGGPLLAPWQDAVDRLATALLAEWQVRRASVG